MGRMMDSLSNLSLLMYESYGLSLATVRKEWPCAGDAFSSFFKKFYL